MIYRKLTLTAAAATMAVGAAAAGPAMANDTAAYFTISGGGLAVSAPAPAEGVDLGSISSTNLLSGGSVALQGRLGDVTVTDSRGALTAAWTATVASTEFVRAGAAATPDASEKVAKGNIAYVATDLEGTLLGPTAPVQTGVGAFVPGVVASMDGLPATRIAGTFAGTGANSVTWNPTVTMTLLSSQVAGRYDGVITHSVA